jgi:23S rRNA (cytosine1962-C5)-methyltransferase
VVRAPGSLSKALQRGHPWIYRDRLQRVPNLPSGAWVEVRCGAFTGYGLWDAESAIAVRLFSQRGVPDRDWVSARIHRAWDRRERLRRPGTTAYRWVYGEGDGLPGIVIDLYGGYAVVQTYAVSILVLLEWVVDALFACADLKGVLVRDESVRLARGVQPPADVVVEENGLWFHVNLWEGQKTGLYLDQRENRRYLEAWCREKSILNCFAYTGAFSVYALRGGAREVVSADIARQAVLEIGRNLALNGCDPDANPALVADCFDLLEQYAESGQLFDMVILDPPSLARAKKSRYAAERAYERLNAAAMCCLPPGGLLATASCTSQVSPSRFREVLGDAAARAKKRLIILHEAGHAIDHPVPAHLTEARYLKFILGMVQEID